MKIVVNDYNLKCFKDKDIYTFDEIIDILRDYECKIDELEEKNEEIFTEDDFFENQ